MTTENLDPVVIEALAAPIPKDSIEWRVDGKPIVRDGKHFARFVPYVTAQFVRERLDETVPGAWDLTLELLPSIDVVSKEGVVTGREYSFKARLQIMGVTREDVGTGDDYKSASSDAFKRAAVRYGVASELYDFGQNWVEVDGDGKYAKPVEDPQRAYERREAKGVGVKSAYTGMGETRPAVRPDATPETAASQKGASTPQFSGASPASRKADSGENPKAGGAPTPTLKPLGPCPKCGGEVWDNRLDKRNPRAPDGKCKNRACDGVLWPPKDGVKATPPKTSSRTVDDSDVRGSLERIDDDELSPLPF